VRAGFPRAAHGAGHNYLIQHSAGSGKTKEIAWLAHDLSTLHQADGKVFEKVIVITDRRVLDRQTRQQIAQFEQVAGVVRSVTAPSHIAANFPHGGATFLARVYTDRRTLRWRLRSSTLARDG
jgi:superfamily I DNA and RNA helicase